MNGTFITFEGPDGSGKTTQLQLLTPWLQVRGYRVLTTREPGGTPIGETIRDLLHDCAHTEMTATAEILLYSASRAQLVREVIQPALQAGHVVLCDRYYDSTYAYQGYGRGLSLDMLRVITEFAVGHVRPDVTFYFDVPPDVGLARRQRGGGEMNRLDREALIFHERVRDGYLAMAKAEPDRWVVVDATPPIQTIQDTLRALLPDVLGRTPRE